MPILSSVVSADKPCVGSFVYVIVVFFNHITKILNKQAPYTCNAPSYCKSQGEASALYTSFFAESFIYTYLRDFLVFLANEMCFRSRFPFCFQPFRQSWTITCYLDTNHKQYGHFCNKGDPFKNPPRKSTTSIKK